MAFFCQALKKTVFYNTYLHGITVGFWDFKWSDVNSLHWLLCLGLFQPVAGTFGWSEEKRQKKQESKSKSCPMRTSSAFGYSDLPLDLPQNIKTRPSPSLFPACLPDNTITLLTYTVDIISPCGAVSNEETFI